MFLENFCRCLFSSLKIETDPETYYEKFILIVAVPLRERGLFLWASMLLIKSQKNKILSLKTKKKKKKKEFKCYL